MKHRLLKDYQLMTPDKRFVMIKARTILENYAFRIKDKILPIDKEIVDKNPEYFAVIDWKEELTQHLKGQGITNATTIAKKVIPFIVDEFIVPKNVETQQKSPVSEQLATELGVDSKIVAQREEAVSIREAGIAARERELDKKQGELNLLEQTLLLKERELAKEQAIVAKKQAELDDMLKNHIPLGVLSQRTQEVLSEIAQSGLDTSLVKEALSKIIQ